MVTPEGKVTAEIKAYFKRLRLSGVKIWAVKIAGGKFQSNGLPDWHVTFNGRSLWFEVKRPGWKIPETLTLQGEMMERIRAAGGFACYVTSVDEVRVAVESLTNLDSRNNL